MIFALLLATQEVVAPTFDFRPVVEDTTLIQARARENFGREQYVLGGEGRVALLRFPDVAFRRPVGAKVKSASLKLTLLRPDAVGSVSVKRLLKSWGEGRGRSVPNVSTKPGDPLAFGNSSWEWSENGVSEGKWALGGAQHESDARDIEGVSAEQTGSTLTIQGLGSAVQNWIDRPLENNGLRLAFSKDAAFFAYDNGTQGPELTLEWEDGSSEGPNLQIVSIEPTEYSGEQAPSKWKAVVKNIGSDASSVSSVWKLPNGKSQSAGISGALGSGESQEVSVNLPSVLTYGDPRRAMLALSVMVPGETDSSDNSLQVPIHGLPVFVGGDSAISLKQRSIEFLNTVVLPFSRFGFAPEGVTERLRLVADRSKAELVVEGSKAENQMGMGPWKSVDSVVVRNLARSLVPISEDSTRSPLDGVKSPFFDRGQLGQLPDTRDDGMRFAGLTMPNIEWYLPKPTDPIFLESGFLSRVEAGYLQTNIGKRGADRGWQNAKLPSGLVVRFLDTQGNPIEAGSSSVYGLNNQKIAEKPISTGKLERGGFLSAKIESKINLENPWLVAEVSQGGEKAQALVSLWDLYDWVLRGNNVAASADVVLMTSNVELDYETNLSTDKIVTDSAGRFPAELSLLVDGMMDTGVYLQPGAWVEIDLSRDRTFGMVEVSTEGEFFGALEIFSFKTGQNPTEAKPFYRDVRAKVTSGLFGQKVGEVTSLGYKSAAVQSRYVRIINTGTSEVKLTNVKVCPAKS